MFLLKMNVLDLLQPVEYCISNNLELDALPFHKCNVLPRLCLPLPLPLWSPSVLF